MSDQDTHARKLLASARALLLDFDGPVCSVFAGIPAAAVADQLRDVLADGGHTDLPAEVTASADPFDVFEYAATLSADDARLVNAAFTAHEAEAVATATTTAGAHELIEQWHASGRPLAIVSSNATPAISAYLDLYGLRPYVQHIAARTSDDPDQLKPNPRPLLDALTALDIGPAQAVMIGDSASDATAATRAGVPAIGYANKPGKAATLTAAGATAVITSMTALAPDTRV